MKRDARLLFIYDSDKDAGRRFVQSLRKALTGLHITVVSTGLTTLLFQIRKYDLAHIFLPAVDQNPLLGKFRGRTRVIQTLLGPAEKEDSYRKLFLGDHTVVFTELEKQQIQKLFPTASVEVIPPCIELPDLNALQPSVQVREKYAVGDNLMVLALSDVSNQQHFDSFLYVVREYSRYGGFRLLIPQYQNDKETLLWRKRLQEQIDKEKLLGTTLLSDPIDLDSLMDASDITLYLRKDRDLFFDVPLSVLQAVSMGKPVLCFDIPPLTEALQPIQPQWICKNNEDIVRESKDLRKAAAKLEQISTELARYARQRFSVEIVAAQYRRIYSRMLT